jgi:putative ABC transport system permease protein
VATALTPLMANQLFGVPPIDPVTYVAVPLILVAIATVAALVPGRRAMRIDPARAMNAS